MSAPLLEAVDLEMRFGGVYAVRGVSLTLERGELRCIIGPNGAGKSTLFNMLAGTLKPVSGAIRFEGQDMVGLPVHRFADHGIARKFQVPSLFSSMSVRDNLDVARRRRDGIADQDERIGRMLNDLGLAAQADMIAAELPHGQKQWLEVGMALMAAPKLLLLDEPTAGMTAEETRKTAKLLTGLAGAMTVVVIEHDMQFVRALACPTLVMHQGQVIASGPFQEIERDTTVRDVYLGRQ
jgi:urea ABC transporter ATP-binding protein UrtD